MSDETASDEPEHVARLRELRAPDDVVVRAARHPSFDDAWDASPTGRDRLWLAAIVGIPVERIAEAAAAAFFAAVERVPASAAVLEAVEGAVAAPDAESAAELADRCERASHAIAGYRDGDRGRDAALARAAGHVCRAFETLRSAEASLETARLLRAHAIAGYMGGGAHAFLPAEAGPATIFAIAPGSVERELLLAAVASAVEAAATLASLLGADAAVVDDAVWDTLTPSGA